MNLWKKEQRNAWNASEYDYIAVLFCENVIIITTLTAFQQRGDWF